MAAPFSKEAWKVRGEGGARGSQFPGLPSSLRVITHGKKYPTPRITVICAECIIIPTNC